MLISSSHVTSVCTGASTLYIRALMPYCSSFLQERGKYGCEVSFVLFFPLESLLTIALWTDAIGFTGQTFPAEKRTKVIASTVIVMSRLLFPVVIRSIWGLYFVILLVKRKYDVEVEVEVEMDGSRRPPCFKRLFWKGTRMRKSRSRSSISFLLSFSLLSILYQSALSDLSRSPISPLKPGDVHRT